MTFTLGWGRYADYGCGPRNANEVELILWWGGGTLRYTDFPAQNTFTFWHSREAWFGLRRWLGRA